MASPLRNGQQVAITQQIPQRQQVWTTRVEGTVVKVEQRPTGSWFAHARGGRLWLDRVTLEKEDGEAVDCILDQYSHIEILREAPKTGTTAASADDGETSESSAD